MHNSYPVIQIYSENFLNLSGKAVQDLGLFRNFDFSENFRGGVYLAFIPTLNYAKMDFPCAGPREPAGFPFAGCFRFRCGISFQQLSESFPKQMDDLAARSKTNPQIQKFRIVRSNKKTFHAIELCGCKNKAHIFIIAFKEIFLFLESL